MSAGLLFMWGGVLGIVILVMIFSVILWLRADRDGERPRACACPDCLEARRREWEAWGG